MDQGARGETTFQYGAEVLGDEAGSATHSQARFSLARWFPLVRPSTLTFATAPVVAVWALLWARGVRLSPLPAASTLLAAWLVLAGANLLDRYVEHERAAPLRDAPVLRGPLPPASPLDDAGVLPQDALRGGVGLLALGALCGIPSALSGGWAVVLAGLVGVGFAVLYSATPYALKRLPGGEIVVALALGPALVGAAILAQGQRMTGSDLLLGLAFGCFALALLEVRHLRDAAADRERHLSSLVTLLGGRGGRTLCAAAFAAAYVFIVLVALQPRFSHGAIAALLALPAAIVPLTGAIRAQARAALQLLVGQTLRAYAVFSSWLVAGFIIAGAAARLYPPIHSFLFG